MTDQQFFSRWRHWVSANRSAWRELMQQNSWVRRTRLAQALKGKDLAKRLGVSPARISMLERDEDRGAVTLKMMQKAARALDCEFVYVLVPKKSLHDSHAANELEQKPKIRIQSRS